MSIMLWGNLNLKYHKKNYGSLFCPEDDLLDIFTQTCREPLTRKMLHFIL